MERRYQRFFDKRQSLEARIHKPKSIRRFKTLALRTMAGDALKVDVNNGTSNFKRLCMTFCMCVSLYDGK